MFDLRLLRKGKRFYPSLLAGVCCAVFLSSVFILQSVAYGAQATFAWDAVNGVAGYKVHYGTTSKSYPSSVDVGNTTTYTITNIPDGTVYYFAASAYDASKIESDNSNEVILNTTACSYTISPTSASFATTGGSGNIAVTTQSGCTWSASSGVSWVTITSGASGTGSGTVKYSVASSTGASRTAASTIAGQVFTFIQSATQSQPYSISASAGTGGSISPTGTVSVSSGTSKAYTITPNSGYRVGNVTVDGASVGAVTAYTFSNVTANHTIAATFAKAATSYTLTITKAGTGSGTVTTNPTGTTFASGTYVTLTATPNSTSTFTGWSGACSGTGACAGTITKNSSVTATFAAKTVSSYTISASAGTGGSISPTGTVSVSSGTSKAYTITPNSGYRVGNITVDGASAGAVTAYTFSNVTANHTIAATFAKAATSYTLTITKAGTGSGTVTTNPTGTSFASGTYVTLKATPNSTSTFTGWSGACSGTGTCAGTITKNSSVTATFKKK